MSYRVLQKRRDGEREFCGTVLKVQQPYASLIVQGKKTLELRSTAVPERHIGTVIGIAACGRRRSSHEILGTVMFTGSEMMNEAELQTKSDMHRCSPEVVLGMVKKYVDGIHGWHATGAIEFQVAPPYYSTPGAIRRQNLQVIPEQKKE